MYRTQHADAVYLRFRVRGIEIDSEAQREILSPEPFYHFERNSRLQLLSHHLKTGLLKPQH
jgi:hypothetical protein